MSTKFSKISLLILAIVLAVFSNETIRAQEKADNQKKSATQEKNEPKKVNFGYSTNPVVKSKKDSKETGDKKSGENKTDETAKSEASKSGKSKKETKESAATDSENKNSAAIKLATAAEVNETFQTVAQKTLQIAKKAARSNLPPTEIYKIGVGDVLFVSLLNVSAQSGKYYTVLEDGTIDFPLAGETVSVLDLTTDELEENLREKIKLYKNPEVSVKIGEYASHKISVSGLTEKPGDKFLQREAIPLFVIKAEALVKPEAEKVSIKRRDSEIEEFDLSDRKTDEILIYSGDILEFTGKASAPMNSSNGFYFIGGQIKNGGQMNFYEGLTLTQAILACGGLTDPDVKKIVIRRKNEKGLLQTTDFNLKDIKKGKAPDPLLEIGDTIEVGF